LFIAEVDPSLPHLAAREGWSYVALEGPRMIHAIAWRDFSELAPGKTGSHARARAH
jgi:hypothetical protein